MNGRIGVGILTHNRLSLLKDLIGQVKITCSGLSYDLVVANDHSTDGTGAWLKEHAVEVLYAPERKGINHGKNLLLNRFQHYSYIFILEDDIEFYKPGWMDLYIKAHELLGLHHLIFCNPKLYSSPVCTTEVGGLTLEHYHVHKDGGQFFFITGRVIETCGGFYSGFGPYGWEHVEYDERIYRAGLSGGFLINHIKESEVYMGYKLSHRPANPNMDRKASGDSNQHTVVECREHSEVCARFCNEFLDTVWVHPKKIKVVIPAWNCERWIEGGANSLLKQSFKDWEAVLIDDNSSDRTPALMKALADSDWRLEFVHNEKRVYALENIVKGFRLLSPTPEDILLVLDGDDCFSDSDALNFLWDLYKDPKVWLTYGGMDKNRMGEVNKTVIVPPDYDYRQGTWVFCQLRSFKGFLWRNVRDKDLRYAETGEYYPAAYDTAMLRPMLEMAGHSHIRLICGRNLYIYNIDSPYMTEKQRELYKLELHCDDDVRKRSRYKLTPYKELLQNLAMSTKHFQHLG